MPGTRRALIVANDTYDNDGLRRLTSPAADAEALCRALGDPDIGAFDDIGVVHNESAHAIQAKIEDIFSDARPDDVLVLHFSCHGLKSESGELFFAARNTRPNRLASTAVPADFVHRCMRATRSRRVVLFLDCCYGGAFGPGVAVRAAGDANILDSFPSDDWGSGRGRAVITASSAMEYAFEDGQLADDHSQRPSVFTSALVEGLSTGDADRDEDGLISLDELYDYVLDRVQDQNPHQTPSRDITMQGEFYLAKSRRRKVRALPLPKELEAAIRNGNMYTRLGAVEELRMRLRSADLGAAAGAHESLTELARTDIDYVASKAVEALAEARIQPSAISVDLGAVVQGGPGPHRLVRLTGPPIARTCEVSVSEQWLIARETADCVDITADTSEVGVRHGAVELHGPTGFVAINVTVQVVDASAAQRSDRVAWLDDGSAVPPSRPPQHRDLTRPVAPLLAEEFNRDFEVGDPGYIQQLTELSYGRRTRQPAGRVLASYLWALVPLLSIGIASLVPIVHAAIALRSRLLWMATSAYGALWITGVVILVIRENSPTGVVYGIGSACFFLVMIAATIHAFFLRTSVFPPVAEPGAHRLRT